MNESLKVILTIKVQLLKLFTAFIYTTIRLEIVEPENTLIRAARKEIKALFAMFHNSYMIPFYINRHRDYAVFTADSPAGEVLTRLIEPQGYTVFRFPPENNPKAAARATIEMINALKNGKQGALTVDGPLGPNEKVKPGIFVIAEKSGSVIYPAGVGMRRCLVLKDRWDKFKIPMPFTKVVAICGEPFEWSHQLDEASLKKDCLRLEQALQDLTRKAEELAKG